MSKTISSELEDKLNELYQITIELEEKTAQKSKVRAELIPLIKENKMEAQKFAIGDKVIKYKLDKQNEGLTQKLLLSSLQDYFGPDAKGEAMKIYKYILGNRQQKVKESIDISRR